MKVLVISLVCACAGLAAGGAVAWPGAIPLSSPYLKTVLPVQTKGFAYSTSQYINALPASYQIGPQPQFSYQFPHLSPFAPAVQPAYYPVAGPSYYPQGTIFYPSVSPIAPVSPIGPQQPQYPVQNAPSTPTQQPSGDADTAVVDSADYPQQQDNQSPTDTPQSQPAKPDRPQHPTQNPPQFPPQQSPQFLPGTFPNFPEFGQGLQESGSFSQIPQGSPLPLPQAPEGSGSPFYPQDSQESTSPSLPQNPQGSTPSFPQPPINFPSNPQFPSGSEVPSFPQFPQGSGLPSFPQFPQFPQGSEGPSFPQFPQFPQGSVPSFPQLPQFPSNPSQPQTPSPSPPSSFPSADNNDKGLNDEDTISVESA